LVGYAHNADRSRWGQGNLITTVHALRRRYGGGDAARQPHRRHQPAGNLMRSVTFFTRHIFILGGLLAVLGAADRARAKSCRTCRRRIHD
jgi:uncharacterized membrane protein